MKHSVAVFQLGILLLCCAFAPIGFAAAAPALSADVNSAVQNMTDKLVRAGKLQGQTVTVSANDFFDTDLNQNLPLSEGLRDLMVDALRARAVAVRAAAGDEPQQWSIHGQWTRRDGELHLTGIARLRDRNGPERAIARSLRLPVEAIDPQWLRPDRIAVARTLIRRLESQSNYQHAHTVHMRPLDAAVDTREREVAKYFEQLFIDSVAQSSLLRLVDQQSLYDVAKADIRQRGIRKKKISGEASGDNLSLASDLLGTDSELRGQLAYDGDSVTLSVALNDRAGVQIAAAEQAIPVALLSADIVEQLQTATASGSVSGCAVAENALAVELVASKGEGVSEFVEGEQIRFYARVDRDAFFYLFDLDSQQRATLLFPSAGTQPIRLASGMPIILPDDNVDYVLEVQAPFGKDTVLAVASETPLVLPAAINDGVAVSALQTALRRTCQAAAAGYGEAAVEVTTRQK